MKQILLCISLIVCSTFSFAEDIKVVYHINEQEKVSVLILSVNELLKSEPHANIKVVVQSSAVTRLSKDSAFAQDFKNLLNKGVDIGACNPSILRDHLEPALMIDGVGLIKEGGIKRIIDLQKQGYIYIKI